MVQEILFVGGVPSCNFVLYKIIEGRRLPRRMKGLGESIRQRGNLRVDSGIRILRSPTEIFEGGETEPPMHASVSMHTAWALRMVSALTSHTLRRYTSPSFVKPATVDATSSAGTFGSARCW